MKRSALKKLSSYNSAQSSTDSTKLVKIGEASQLLGVSIDTLRRWERKGWLKTVKTPGGTRLYDREQLVKLNPNLKRGPKTLVSPVAPIVKNTTEESASTQLLSNTSLNNQNVTKAITPNITLATDKPVLKTTPYLSQPVIDSEISRSKEVMEYSEVSLFSTLMSPLSALKPSLIAGAITVVLVSLLILPGVLLTNYIKNTQSASALSNKYNNNSLVASAEALKTLAGIFTPTLSQRFFGNIPPGSPPGAGLAQRFNKDLSPATKRDLGYLNGGKISGSTGQVLAESTGSANFLQINIDAELNGNLAVDGEGFFTGNVTAPNLVYTITAGDNIEISGDPQNPVISATGVNFTETDTLQTVTARGAVTTIASTFSGGITTSSLNLAGTLNMGQLSSDPGSGVNGATYYNTTSNTFRCYISGSWQACDTDTTGSSFAGLTLAGDTGTQHDLASGDTITLEGGNGISTTGTGTDTVTLDLNIAAGSGLEANASGLSLLTSCNGNEVLRWNAGTSQWECSASSGSAVVTVQEGDGADFDNSSITALDFLGGDFDLSLDGASEADIKLAATLTSVIGVAGNFDVAGSLAAGTGNAFTVSTAGVIAGASLTLTPTTANALTINQYGTGAAQSGELRFMEGGAGSTNYVGFKAPDGLATDKVYILPDHDNFAPSADQVLTWQSGDTLRWKSVSGVSGAGDITAVGDVTSDDAFTNLASLVVSNGNNLWFEGTTIDGNDINLVGADPSVDQTITIPALTGTIAIIQPTSGGAGTAQIAASATGSLLHINETGAGTPNLLELEVGATDTFVIANSGATTITTAAGTDLVNVFTGNLKIGNSAPTQTQDGEDAYVEGILEVDGIIYAGSGTEPLTVPTGKIDADAIALTVPTDGLTGTSSASGLATYSNTLSLLQGCGDGEILKWNESSDLWACSSDSGATSAVVNIQEESVTVGTSVDTLNFAGTDFSITTPGGPNVVYIQADAATFGNSASTFNLVDTTGTKTIEIGGVTSDATNTIRIATNGTSNPDVIEIGNANSATTLALTGGDDWSITAGGAATFGGTFIANGAFTLGDGGDTGAINTSDWDISATGAITNATYEGLTISTTTGTFTLAAGKTFAVNNSLTFNGTDGNTLTFPAGNDTVVTLTATQTLTNKTLTAPRFADGGFLADANGNEMLILDSNASAVNELTISNAATGNGVAIAATGGDTDVALSIDAKAAGVINIGNNSTGNILLGGGSASTGCTLTNSTGAFACSGAITASNISGSISGTNTGDQNLFSSIVVPTQTTITANSTTTALNVEAGTGISLTTDNSTKTLTIAATGSGGDISAVGNVLTGSAFTGSDSSIDKGNSLVFEGDASTDDANDLTLTSAAISGSSKTITLPNLTGTVALLEGTQTFTGAKTFDDLTIADTDISFSGASTTFTTTGTLTLNPGGAVTLGDGGDTLTINSSDWDISATGAITNATYEGLTITSTTGTFTLAAAKTLTVNNTLTFDGTDGTTFTFPSTTGTVVTTAATQTLTNKTLTAPRFADGGFLADASGNEILVLDSNASAVNQLTITNSATGNDVTLAATGDDTDVALSIDAKGAGVINIGNNSTGNLLLGGGVGSSGCTLTNSSGAFACTGAITGSNISGSTSGTNTGDQNVFTTIVVAGQSNVVTDSASDTLTLVAGSGATITTDAATDTVTISATGTGGDITAIGNVLAGSAFTGTDSSVDKGNSLVFEGDASTDDADDLTLTSAAITGSSKTITLPNLTGTVALLEGTQTFTGAKTFADLTVSDTDVAFSGASTTFTTTGAFTLNPGGAVTLGDGGDTLAINSSDWDISNTGAITNATYEGLTISTTTGTFTLAAGKTFTVNNTLTFDGTDGTTFTFPSTTGTVVTTAATQTLTNKTLTAPRFADGGFLADSSGNEILILDSNASAVNQLTISNSATGNGLTIAATGDDTDVALSIDAKGAGVINIGNTSTGDLVFGGGSSSTGCTLTNSTGAFACSGAITGSNISGSTSGTNTGDQNVFTTIAVSGQSNVVTDATSDTLTLVAGSGATITTDASTDTITISATGTGGDITAVGDITTGDAFTNLTSGTSNGNELYFEGSTADGNDILLTAVDPGSDFTITLPAITGTVALLQGTQTFTGAKTFDDLIVADTNVAFTGASTTFTTTGAFTLTPGGAVTLGDGGDTMAIDTSDWDINATGGLTGITGIANDGSYTQTGTSANALTGATTFSRVNAAGGSVDAVTLAGTLGIFDGSDTFRGLYLNYTNADHTGSGNTFNGIEIAGITADAQATENALNIGNGWDNDIFFERGSNDVQLRVTAPTGATRTLTVPALTADRTIAVSATAPVVLDPSTGDISCPTCAVAGGAGGSLFTDGGATTYLTSTTDNFAIGGTDETASPFGVNVSAQSLYVGSGSSASGNIIFKASDGDTGTFAYNTSDQFTFSGGTIAVTPTAAGAVTLNQFGTSAGETAELRFMEGGGSSTQYVAFKAPDSLSTNMVYTLPNHDASAPSADYVLTYQSGNVLEWKSVGGVSGAGDITAVGDITTGAAFTNLGGGTSNGNELYFEGATADGNDILLTAADPGSDFTITLPALTGTVALLEGTQTFTGAKTFDDLTVADTNISFSGASTTFTTTGAFTLTPGGAVTLGDGGDTMAINTSDWDISATGAITNATYEGLTITTTTGTFTLAAGKTFVVNNGLTFDGTDGTTFTFPSTTGTVVTTAATQTLTNKTLTAPRFADGGFLADSNGNEILVLDSNTSAVNQLTIDNSATGNGLTIAATGDDTDVSLSIDAKGAGVINIGNNSTGNLVFGGGSGSTGCTLTNATGAFACTAAITASNISGSTSGTNTGDQNVFTTIAVSGESNVVSDAASDTLTLVAGTGVTIANNAGTDTITISATGTGGDITAVGDITTGDAFTNLSGGTSNGNQLYFEGATADGNDILLTAVDPGSDFTITLPGITGTVALLEGTQTFTGAKTFADLTVSDTDVAFSGASTTFTTTGAFTLTPGGAVTLGDGGDTMAINTSDWDISATGAITNATYEGLTISTTTGTFTLAAGKTFTVNNGLTFDGTDGTTFTFPSTTGTVVTTAATQTLTNKTLTAPRFADGGFLADSSGNEMLILDSNASAVNQLTISNAATGNGVTIAATGDDTDVDLSIDAKGAGVINIGNTSTGDLVFGGGSSSTGCTLTNASGNFACSGTVTGSNISGTTSGTNTGDQNVFTTIAVSGESNIVSDATSDTLTLVAGTGVTITNNAGTDTITLSATGTGGDITAVGDITTGDAFTNLSGGTSNGNQLYFEGATADGNDILLTAVDPGSDFTITLPGITGTVALLEGTQTFTGAKTFADLTVSDTDVAFSGASTTFTTTGAFNLTPGGAVTLGDGGDTLAINSNDWDITAAGAITNATYEGLTIGTTTGTFNLTNAKTLAVTNTLTLSGTDGETWTFPDATGGSSGTVAALGQIQTFSEANTFTKVNAAGGSADSVTLSGTLGAFDGSDTFRGMYLNYTNADHTGATNVFNGLDIAGITGDAQATETAVNIGAGWDSAFSVGGTTVINGSGQVVAGTITGTLFTISDGTTPQAIAQGNTINFVDGTDTDFVTSATNNVTVNDTSTLATVTGRGATTTTLVNLNGGIATDTNNFTVSGTTGATGIVGAMTTGDALAVSFDSATQTGALTGVSIDFANITSDATNTVYGLRVADLGVPSASTEYAIYQSGTDWDYGIYIEDAALFNTTLAVNGTTIGLDLDADADNLIGTSAAAGSAASDLYWGDDLVCDVSETNCGWASAASSPWTTDSNVVNLVTDGDTVTIGSNTALGKLSVDGDADEVQLYIQGNGTQTSNLALFEQSGGTDVLTISNTGVLTLAGSQTSDITSFVTAGAGAALTLKPGTSTGASNNGAAVNITGGDGSGTTSVTGGALNLTAGAATGGSGTRNGGTVIINGGNGATADGAVTIGSLDTTAINLGNGTNNTTLTLTGSGLTTLGGSLTVSGTSLLATSATTITLGSTGADTIILGNGGADSITIGGAAATSVAITDDNWSINASGVITTTGLANLNGGIAVDSTNFTVDGSTGAVVTASTVTANTDETINGIDISAGAISDVTGFTQISGAYSVTMTTTNAAQFASSTANSDTLRLLPQSGTATNTFNGIITSADLTGADKTWTFPNLSGVVCVAGDTCATSGTVGYWSRNAGTSTLSPSSSGDNITTTGNISTTSTGTITSAGLLTGQAGLTVSGGAVSINDSSNNTVSIGGGTTTSQVSIGTGASTQTIAVGTGAGAKTTQVGSTNSTSGTTVQSGTGDLALTSTDAVLIDSAGLLELNSSAGAINIGNDSVAQPINIGTGSAARTITIGNATGASALAFNSGTGSQTFTSLVDSGTTTTSAFVFDAAEIKAGTGMYVTADELTTGKLAQFATTGNTLTTGTLVDIRSTATSLTGTAGIGSLANLDWSPGSATTATGDLFSLNIGTNGTTTGKLFNILDTAASIFSISETSMETSLPANFTSPGDVSIAYDLNFTNPTASYIKSYSALTINPGDPFGSSNLTLQTYNEGSVYVPTNVATGYGVDIDANSLSTGRAVDISSTSTAGGASGSSYLLYLDRSGANSNATHTAYGVSSSVTNTGTTNTNIAGLFSASGASTTNTGVSIAAVSTAATTNNGISIGAVTGATNNYEINFGGTSPEVAMANGGTLTFSDGTNTLCQIIDAGITGTFTCTGSGALASTLQDAYNNDVDGSDTRITLNATDGSLVVRPIAGTNFQVEQVTSAPTTDMVSITNSGLGTTTNGVDGISLVFVTGNGADPTNNGLNVAVTSGGTATTDITNAINLGLTSTAGGTDRAINIADNTFDTDINAATDLTLGIGGTNEVSLTATNFAPSAAEGNSLGSASAEWEQLFVGDDNGVSFGLDQDFALAYDEATDDRLELTATNKEFNIALGNQDVVITGSAEGTAALTLTAGDAIITDGDLTVSSGETTLASNSNAVATLSLTNNTATTFGNGANTAGVIDFQSTSLTTGNFMNMEVNALTTGKGINLTNTTTLTTGTLLYVQTASTALAGTATTGNGLLGNFDWTPGSATTATGDLFRLHIGPNGTTTGALFNIVDDTSSIFSVKETAFETSLPSNFTSSGDLAVAYDLNFTNPVASFINSSSALTIKAGETFNSSNLSLQTYNAGSVVIESGSSAHTGTNGLVDINVNTATTNNIGLNVDYTVDAGSGTAFYGSVLNLTLNDVDGGLRGTTINNLATSAAVGTGDVTCLLCVVNAENTASVITDAILIDSTSGTDTDITDAIDASDSNIVNALNLGTNTILASGSFSVDLVNGSADTMSIVNSGAGTAKLLVDSLAGATNGVIYAADSSGTLGVTATGGPGTLCLTSTGGAAPTFSACAGASVATLQESYDADVDGSDTRITLNATDGSLVVRPIAGTNFQVEQVTSAPTTDMVSITNSGLGTTTNGVDGISLVFVTGNGADPTNNGLNIAMTSGGTATTDITNAINLAVTSTAGGTDRAINIADNSFDTDINATTDLTLAIGGTNEVSLSATAFAPVTDEGSSLGDDTHRWQDLFLGGETLHIGTSTSDEAALSYTTASNTTALNNTAAGNINIGTTALQQIITVGNATSATALNFNSGTGSQTFTSLVDSGTTTTSAFVFDATEIKAGTGMYVTADELTTGKLAQFTSNSLTSGTLVDVRSTATSLTGTAGIGSLANLDWSPGSTTTATGDLFSLNIGTNGTTTGKLFNILDTSSSVFSVSETSMETSLPANFTSPGDVAIAYDLNFTNPTASFIKSLASLNIEAGETFGSSNLFAKVYNAGSIVFESGSSAHTGTSGLVDINDNSSTSGNIGLNIDFTEDTGTTSGGDLFAQKINLTQNDADGDLFGLDINSALQSGTTASIDSLIRLRQLDTTASNTTTLDNALFIDSEANSGMSNAIQILGSAGTIGNGLLIEDAAGTITDGIELAGTFTNLFNAPNFDINNAGNITVAANEGLDTNGAGVLEIGFANASSVSVGTVLTLSATSGEGLDGGGLTDCDNGVSSKLLWDDTTNQFSCGTDAGGASSTLQQAYEAGNTIDITSGEGALDVDLQTANFDIEVGAGADTGDFRIWDGSVNWLFVDESADTLALGAAAGSGITIGGTGITTTNSGAMTVTQTLTANGAFDANGQFDLGDGGDAGTISATTLDIDATGALQINSSGGAISIGNDAVAQAINIGTGGAARTMTFGNASFASNFVFNSGATTTTAFALNTDSITSGNGLDLSVDSNSLTSGNGLNITSTSTSTAFSGSLINLDWSATGSVTNTADLFSINIGSGDIANSFINLLDNGSSVFKVSQTAFETSLPSNFTAAGDVAIAYDINFTNPTASYIKSAAPLYMVAGETFNSSDLTLQTYNTGAINLAVGTNGIINLAADPTAATINIAGSTNTAANTINIATGTGADTINIGTGATGADSINIGTGTAVKTISIGSGNIQTKVVFAQRTAAPGADFNTNGQFAIGTLGVANASGRLWFRANNLNFRINTSNNSADYSEFLQQSETSEPGDVMVLADDGYEKVEKSKAAYDQKVLGVVTQYGTGGNNDDCWDEISCDRSTKPNWANVGMLGQVYTKVSIENGNIQPGDPLTTSSTTGVAMKATREGRIVGYALDAFNGSASGKDLGNYPTAGTWDVQTPSGTKKAGKIIILLQAGWFDPAAPPAMIAETEVEQTQPETQDGPPIYSLSNSFNGQNFSGGELVRSDALIANLETGSLSAKSINVTNGSSSVFRVDTKGNVILGAPNLTTTSTDGYAYLPSVSGIPTAAPTTVGGHTAITYDKVNNKICAYNAGWNCIGASDNDAAAALSLDVNGNLVLPNVKANKITVASDVIIGGIASATGFNLDASTINRTGALATLPVNSEGKTSLADVVNSLNSQINQTADSLNSLADQQASQSAELAEARVLGEQAVEHALSLDDKVASTSSSLSSLSDRITDLLNSFGSDDNEGTDSGEFADGSDLTPPDVMFATGSATLANLKVTENLSTLNLEAMDATVSATFKSLGETFLGQTTIAGDLSVDGTMSFTNGNSINAFPTLFLQNSPLAQAVDIFNGAVTIDNTGLLSVESLALGAESLGEAIIGAGQIEITIPTSLINTASKIFLTPNTPVLGNLYVGTKITGQGFKVRLSEPNFENVQFNWLIIQSKEASN